MQKAVVINTGSELVEGRTLNSNAKYICEKLAERGFVVKKVLMLDDDLDLISSTVSQELLDNDLLIITGGLGPTEDDKTREAVAKALNRSLYVDQELANKILDRVKKYYSKIPENIVKQAEVIEGAKVIPNEVGTAPGQLIELPGKKIVILPGPPQELIPMFEKIVNDLKASEDLIIVVMTFFGIPESVIDETISQLEPSKEIKVTTQATYDNGVKVRLIANKSISCKVNEFAEKLIKKFKEAFVGFGDLKLEEVVVNLLKERGKKLAVAESCTGGLISSRIVSVPGASQVFLGSVVAYDNDVKIKVLGVSSDTLKKFGAVSQECAMEMALGIEKLTGADICVAVTGIAGPTGGTVDKPVGTVYIAVKYENNCQVIRLFYPHERNIFRMRISGHALFEVVKRLKGMI
ncbi:CinA family nicotinamide mononucleotide deamidase-related protein [Pseudothermotoga thermarum]|uniref:CinA-like protein n=1 Tax=Pseudothermotoga thermarum DSM 5069 TaxID=688269 RepID=F7YXX7_9THEM|nr:CinA family nicotinamide mononucleotide deamidase-related protein [Pseudothermotoga thermarum]AEH50776.1 competence/damage-inducible protein cinA [Pseudothermotoga thermarum DSM 5069]